MNEVIQYKNYRASVNFSRDDNVFYGKILSTTDLVSFEGTSIEILKKAFEEAVDDYLVLCRQIGKPEV